MAEVEIGRGKTASRGYHLDQVAIVPSRRTRDADAVDLGWSIDAFRFDTPLLGAPSDGICGPESIIELSELGALGTLHLEGVFTRHEDPVPDLQRLADIAASGADTESQRSEVLAVLRRLHEAPVVPQLISDRVAEMRDRGATAAVAVSPRRVEELLGPILAAEPDLLVIAGPITSAEVLAQGEPLNLKNVLRRLDVPVLVGGCTSYHAALHLMRTGAAGVLAGVGPGHRVGTANILGIATPQATAIADARAARMRHLDETGVYCHVIAHGGVRRAGDIAKAIACGADAVMVGSPLARSFSAPGHGWMWGQGALHPTLPRGIPTYRTPRASLREILDGPSPTADGAFNLVGGLRKAMALAGYGSVKEFQKAELVLTDHADTTEPLL